MKNPTFVDVYITDRGSCVQHMFATPYFLLYTLLVGSPVSVLYVLIESSSPAVTNTSSHRWKSRELTLPALSCDQNVIESILGPLQWGSRMAALVCSNPEWLPCSRRHLEYPADTKCADYVIV